ncbi:MAG: tetratricopeptide repeat protein [Wenzhouxiangella sp.]|nr:tetratricopeptide repeat protein [Wenzhouxiangella sp.]
MSGLGLCFATPLYRSTLSVMSSPPPENRLESWKAIARHLGRSVRTVRRWEQHEQLPVHRLVLRSKASVYAFATELDEWLASRAAQPGIGETRAAPPAGAARAGREGDFSPTSIAVLPFTFAGPDPGQAWVADGFTEEMINGFSALRGLRVTSRTSSIAFKGSDQHSGAIADILGVARLLEGGVVGDGRRLRITVRLIDPNRDNQIWSRQYTGTMDQVFDIQERIARAVVAALQVHLEPAEDRRLARRGLHDLEAWRRVVQARQEALRWRPDALDRARMLLEEAIELAGDHPEITAAMGRTLLNVREAGIDVSDGLLKEAGRWADRAESVDPQGPGTLVLRAWLHYARGDFAPAIQGLRQALAVDHDQPDALGLLSYCLLLTGQEKKARPVVDHLLAVDPLTPLTVCLPGMIHAMEGRFKEAVEPYREMLAKDPGNPVARLFCTWSLFNAGAQAQALAVAAGFEAATHETAPAHVARLYAAAHQGTLDDGGLAPSVRERVEAVEMFARCAAEAFAMGGDVERATHWLGVAVDRGFANYPYISKHSPFFRKLPETDALRSLKARIHERWASFQEAD